MNCNDCGTALKHLFGPKWYCPNDCDKKPKNVVYYNRSLLPMWGDAYSPSMSTGPGGSLWLYKSRLSFCILTKGIPTEFKVMCGCYTQKLMNHPDLGEEMIKLDNISETDLLILVSK